MTLAHQFSGHVAHTEFVELFGAACAAYVACIITIDNELLDRAHLVLVKHIPLLQFLPCVMAEAIHVKRLLILSTLSLNRQ